jgi:hypothetical protein
MRKDRIIRERTIMPRIGHTAMSLARSGEKIKECDEQGRPQYGPQHRERVISEPDPGEKGEIQLARDEGTD